MNTTQILVSEKQIPTGKLGQITLNRPEALNALSIMMCEVFNDQIKKWEMDPEIIAVIIQGQGDRAFCAGGDVKAIYEIGREDIIEAMHFFSEEYQLNRRIHHFPKPYIALMHGICMGGGVGISVNGQFRVAATDLRMAMPETKIGFYPDVGATFFLSRCPGEIGTYMGLTGNDISASDALYAGLVDYIVEKNNFIAILDALVASEDWNPSRVHKTLEKFEIKASASQLSTKRKLIDECFSADSVEEILHALNEKNDPWCQEIGQSILKRSPTSLKITLSALRKAKKMGFNECMAMEYEMTENMLKGRDFFEGVRAAVIDKDNNPQWEPAN